MLNYKDSGIEWIGEIPAHWEVSRIKYNFEVISGATPDNGNTEFWDGEIAWVTPADMDDTGYIDSGNRNITLKGYRSCGTKIIPKGSILVSNRAPIGKINYTLNNLCTNQGCKGLVRNENNTYFYYLMTICVERLLLLGRGTTFLELSTRDLSELEIIIPELKEQKRIANFLDKKCSEIDFVIEKIEKQIELLKDYKKSLITENVTKGLNKSLPMKDSGIEWIGEIPEHWNLSKIKYITKIPITDGPHETPLFIDEGVPFYSVDSIVDNKMIYYPSRYISLEDANRFDKKVKPMLNDILLGKAASTGKIAIVDKNLRFQIWSPLALIRVDNIYYHSKYLMYYLLSDSGQIEIELRCTNNTQKNISMYDINKIVTLTPSIIEQQKISDFLDKKCLEINSVISKKERQLDLIKEHRKSLIYEYVTGKKRIRGVKDGN